MVSKAEMEIGAQAAALDLVNSEWWFGSGPRVDLLEQGDWLARFTAAHGFGDVGSPDAGELTSLRTVRALLRRLATVLDAGGSLGDDDVAALGELMRRRPLVRTLSLERGDIIVGLAPVRRDWAWVVGEIAASFAELIAADPSRVKVCDNAACGFVYLDTTKNRSRRWCAPEICGNRHKLRRYRERHRAADTTTRS